MWQGQTAGVLVEPLGDQRGDECEQREQSKPLVPIQDLLAHARRGNLLADQCQHEGTGDQPDRGPKQGSPQMPTHALSRSWAIRQVNLAFGASGHIDADHALTGRSS